MWTGWLDDLEMLNDVFLSYSTAFLILYGYRTIDLTYAKVLIMAQTLLGQICDRLTSGEAIVKKDFNFSFYETKITKLYELFFV